MDYPSLSPQKPSDSRREFTLPPGLLRRAILKRLSTLETDLTALERCPPAVCALRAERSREILLELWVLASAL